MTNFPFDNQQCSIDVAVWGYDTREITIFGTKKDSRTEIVGNNAWSLDRITVDGMNTDGIPFLSIKVHTTRRFEYFLINVLLPPILLSVVSPSVFLLPASSGERMSFAITCFLAFGVFMSLLSDNMPKSSVPISKLSFFLMYMLIQSCAVTFCAIMSLRVYQKQDTTDQVPPWLRHFVAIIRFIPCKRRCHSNKNDIADSAIALEEFEEDKVPHPAKYVTKRHQKSASIKPSNNGEHLDITWYTVGRTLDFFFFAVFLGWTLFTTITSLMSLSLI